MISFPTLSDVDQIATLTDPVIRNLQITQCYHELSAALAERTGLNANWCTFATWASKQAGQTIRKEDLGRALEEALRTDANAHQAAQEVAFSAQAVGALQEGQQVQELALEAWDPASVFDRASEAMARGNRKVFAEIGHEFARFCTTCLSDETFDESKIELLLLANLEIGLHEQTRLQPEILEALDAALIEQEEFVRRLLEAIFRRRGWIGLACLFLLRLFGRLDGLERAVRVFAAAVRRLARILLTETMMTIPLPPDIRLRLSDDLSAAFPASLRQIENPDLRALLAQIDPTPDSTRESGARDWGDLLEHIHFIADMFRCYEESSDLFSPPFTPDQVAALKSGQLPEGRL